MDSVVGADNDDLCMKTKSLKMFLSHGKGKHMRSQLYSLWSECDTI